MNAIFLMIFLEAELISIIFMDCVGGQNISGSYFNCPILSTSGKIPTSVHKLRPNDIKLVGAMGDSFTAGFGTSSIGVMLNETEFVPRDNKGASWNGGDNGNISSTTLPNILRMYNPKLRGFSTGGLECNISSTYNLNVAQRDATGKNMLQQAEELVRRAKKFGNDIFINDWKLVTIYVGTNDICRLSCLYSEELGADYWINNITEALNYLKDYLPRTFVNLVQLMNIGDVMTSTMSHSRMGYSCTSSYVTVCTCANMDDNDTELEDFIQLIEYYQMMLYSAISFRDDEMNNFTVVLQPFMQTVTLDQNDNDDNVDLSPFSSNCFHLSPLGHRNLAVGLWNNMFEIVGNKTTNLKISRADLKCPSEAQPYLYTSRNSVETQLGKAVDITPSFNLVPNREDETMLWAVWIPPGNLPIIHNHTYIMEVVCNDSIRFQLSRSHSVNGNITVPLTGLTSATAYMCAVFGNRTELLSNYSTAATWGGNVPSVPNDLILLPLVAFPTKLMATWFLPDYSNGIIDYKLSCNTVDAVFAPFSLITASTRVHADNLLPYTNYTCTVRARNNMGVSSYSTAVYTQTYQSGPSSPTIVSTRAISINRVWLQWKAPDQLNGILQGYKISYYETGHTKKSFVYVGADSLKVNITDLKPYTNYSFTVQGRTVDEGSYSNTITILTLEGRPGPLRKVIIVNVTANSTMTSWLPPDDPNGIIIHYNIIVFIYREDKLNYQKVTTFREPSHVKLRYISDLTAYRKYKISISASTAIGEGEYVGIDFLTKTSISGPPSKVRADAKSSESLFIEWSFPTDPGGKVRGYKIQLSTSSNLANAEVVYQKDIRLLPSNYWDSANVTVTNLVPYSAYYAMIQAYAYEYDPKDIRYGKKVVVGPIRTLEAASSPPTKVTGTPASSMSINVTWSAPDSTNGVIKYYKVTYYPHNETHKLQAVRVMDPIKKTQLQNLQMYTFYVILVRAFTIEYSDSSSMIIVRTLQGAPSAPSINMARSDCPNIIYIAWDPPKEMNGEMKAFAVKYFKSGTSEKQANVQFTRKQEMNITGLDPSTMYSIFVTASTEVAEGPRSQMFSLLTASNQVTEVASMGEYIHEASWSFHFILVLMCGLISQ